jgi:hypothetical protein
MQTAPGIGWRLVAVLEAVCLEPCHAQCLGGLQVEAALAEVEAALEEGPPPPGTSPSTS